MLAAAFAMASAATAAPLVGAAPARSGSLPPGVARGRAVAVDRGALADLRGRASSVVRGFPLGADATVDLELTRFEPFSPAARVEVVGDGGVHEVPLPDATYFAGEVQGDPGSRALLIAGRDGMHGFVVANGTVYPFGPDGAGGHRSYALRDADPALYPPPGDFCANDLHPDVVDSPAVSTGARVQAGLEPAPFPRAATTTLLQADVAIETDHELWAKFGSDQGTLDYLASLAAAGTAIYERDVSVRLRFSYIRLWATTADPWSATSTSSQLNEVQAYWTNPANNMNAIAGPHDLVHFVSGKAVQGGIAYIGSVCNAQYAFGVSQVFGSFDLSSPTNIWDVVVTTHEMGHNLGSPHTHCYSPPLDKCYNQETGCYSGPIVASRGTIMSYCHLLSGGLANIDLVFGPVVSTTIRNTAEGASCLTVAGTCGNGIVEPSEQCDDGNTVSGDGCSATCRLESCGNGIIDFGETCDDGNTVSGDGCSATCQREPRCGDGVLDPGEQCDDGNTVSGDGCSSSCKREACKVTRAGQTIWTRAQMMVQRGGAGRDRLSFHGEFTIPVAVDTIDPAAMGVVLLVQDPNGDDMLQITLPPGPHWLSRRGQWIYKDPAGTAAGIRKLEVTDHTRGGVPEVDVKATGRGRYGDATAALPPTVTVVLGDDASGLAGACGRYTFGGAACAGGRSRIVCK
jgi:cysteine-rich repeat protein